MIGLDQLRALGLTASAVRKRVQAGKLHRIHRGVYAVGHPALSLDGRLWAAVLACGPGAVLSHRSAAARLGLRPDSRPTIDITAPTRRTRDGITAHECVLHPTDIASHGIPCTTVARTLLDLAEVLDRRGLERAIDRAEQLRVFDLAAVDAVLARANGRRGAGSLRDVLRAYTGETLTRNDLEERFLAICRSGGVPQPRVNEWIALEDGSGYEGDFVWPAERLIVETDGHASHGTRRAFGHDRRRDRLLTTAGWRVVRFTWEEVIHEPHVVAAALMALLGRHAQAA